MSHHGSLLHGLCATCSGENILSKYPLNYWARYIMLKQWNAHLLPTHNLLDFIYCLMCPLLYAALFEFLQMMYFSNSQTLKLELAAIKKNRFIWMVSFDGSTSILLFATSLFWCIFTTLVNVVSAAAVGSCYHCNDKLYMKPQAALNGIRCCCMLWDVAHLVQFL